MTRLLYCDESIWVPVAAGLEARGWSATTAHAEETLGDTDREQLALARTNDWLLVTFDDDFLSLVEGDGVEHAGVLYVQQADRRVGDVVRAIDGFLEREGVEYRDVGYA